MGICQLSNFVQKDTLNVDYKSRITNQKVIFANDENEYYGTFRGQTEISGSRIIDSVLKNDSVEMLSGDLINLEDAILSTIQNTNDIVQISGDLLSGTYLSNYYQKDETSSNIEISTNFIKTTNEIYDKFNLSGDPVLSVFTYKDLDQISLFEAVSAVQFIFKKFNVV